VFYVRLEKRRAVSDAAAGKPGDNFPIYLPIAAYLRVPVWARRLLAFRHELLSAKIADIAREFDFIARDFAGVRDRDLIPVEFHLFDEGRSSPLSLICLSSVSPLPIE